MIGFRRTNFQVAGTMSSIQNSQLQPSSIFLRKKFL